jgi:peptidoglycan/xylan/chitin deacetylase (PgdA/CDA1 family)
MYRNNRKYLTKYFHAIKRLLLGTITSVKTDEPFVALTFDDGPHPVYTPRLLEILKKFNAKATFFVVGELAVAYPSVIKQIKEAGHVVGNHSWDHSSFPGLASKVRRHQIRKSKKAIGIYGSRFFRPPFGHQNMGSRLDAFLMGYEVITWNVLADDWMDLPAKVVANHLLERVDQGAIVLLHDGLYHALEKRFADRSATLEAVERFLYKKPEINDVTISDLLRSGRAVKKMWEMPADQSWLRDMQKTIQT